MVREQFSPRLWPADRIGPRSRSSERQKREQRQRQKWGPEAASRRPSSTESASFQRRARPAPVRSGLLRSISRIRRSSDATRFSSLAMAASISLFSMGSIPRRLRRFVHLLLNWLYESCDSQKP
jgi:hypothetical protein